MQMFDEKLVHKRWSRTVEFHSCQTEIQNAVAVGRQ